LNDFSNPGKVAEYFDQYDIKYAVQSYEPVYANEDEIEYTNATI